MEMNMPENYRGTLVLIAGVLLLLYALDWIHYGLHYFIIFSALGMIIYGFIKMNGVALVKTMINKKKSIIEHEKHNVTENKH